MDPIKDLFKKSGMSNLLVSIIFGLLGVILCIFHEGAIKAISWLIGLLFLVIGISRIVTYIQGRGRGEYYNFNLLSGLLSVLIGLFVIIFANAIGAVIRIIIALWILYSGINRAYLSFKLKDYNTSIWISSLILAIIMIILGIYILFNNGAIISLIGGLIIAYAIIDIIESICFMKNLKRF